MSLYDSILRPILFRFPAEAVHELGMNVLRTGVAPRPSEEFDFGPVERFGLKFPNPLGLAAGFDKNGVAATELLGLGFGFVEVGTVTLKPQPGNPKPRLFRLPDDSALINRLGFNNKGAAALVDRLAESEASPGVIGVNIGRNKDVDNEHAIENYLACFETVYPVADYVVVNISSPNTPNLRELQQQNAVRELMTTLLAKRGELAGGAVPKPLLVKIAPDLSENEIAAIVEVVLDLGISGIVATNTTIGRSGLATANPERFGAGGLSGRPLTQRSTEVIRTIARVSGGKLPIIGVGGIFTAEDAFEKVAAGACLVQAYTGFVYGGPGFARTVIEGLNKILAVRDFRSYEDAIGSAR